MALELTEEQKAAGWQHCTVGGIANVVTGSTPSKNNPEHWGNEIPFLTPSDQNAGTRSAYTARSLSYEGREAFQKRIVGKGAVAVTCIGATIGKVSYIRADTVTNQQINSIVADEKNAHGLYLYYLFMTLGADLLSIASGSATPIVSKRVLENLELVLPPLVEQKRIAEILGSVDDKIEANSRLLESLYRLLYEVYEFKLSQGSYKVLLTEIAEFVNGKAFTKNATGTGRMVVRIAELNGGPGASTVYNDLPEVEPKYLVNPGEVLMSWSGSLGVYLWPREQAIVNQHIFKVIPKPGYSLGAIYCALQSVLENFQAIAQDKATTMGHIKRGDLERSILVPADVGELENIFSLISLIEQENISLINTRDLLIRHLIG